MARILEGYYTPTMGLLRVDSAVFSALLPARLPALASHLNDTLGFPDLASLFLPRWFLCLFLNCFPADITARIWDAVFLDALVDAEEEAAAAVAAAKDKGLKKGIPRGAGPRVLLETALALLAITERDLLACASFADAVNILRDVSTRVLDPAELLLLTRYPCASLRAAPLAALRESLAAELYADVLKAEHSSVLSRSALSPGFKGSDSLSRTATASVVAQVQSPAQSRARTPVNIEDSLHSVFAPLAGALSPLGGGLGSPLGTSAGALTALSPSVGGGGGDDLRRRALRSAAGKAGCGSAISCGVVSPPLPSFSVVLGGAGVKPRCSAPADAMLSPKSSAVASVVNSVGPRLCAADLAAALNPTIAASASRKRSRAVAVQEQQAQATTTGAAVGAGAPSASRHWPFPRLRPHSRATLPSARLRRRLQTVRAQPRQGLRVSHRHSCAPWRAARTRLPTLITTLKRATKCRCHRRRTRPRQLAQKGTVSEPTVMTSLLPRSCRHRGGLERGTPRSFNRLPPSLMAVLFAPQSSCKCCHHPAPGALCELRISI